MEGRNIIVEGHGSGELLTSAKLQEASRAERKGLKTL
jgi:hypothetical protein